MCIEGRRYENLPPLLPEDREKGARAHSCNAAALMSSDIIQFGLPCGRFRLYRLVTKGCGNARYTDDVLKVESNVEQLF